MRRFQIPLLITCLLYSTVGAVEPEPPDVVKRAERLLGIYPGGGMFSEISVRDLDGDGHDDQVFEAAGLGSGWKEWTTCIVDGKNAHLSCNEYKVTSYGPFTGWRIVNDPSNEANRAARHHETPTCKVADRDSAKQAAMWRLLTEQPRQGRLNVKGPWHPGKPSAQEDVCLSASQAGEFARGFAWDASGPTLEEVYEQDWIVIYIGTWPRWRQSGVPTPTEPEKQLGLDGFEVYKWGHALAVYDVTADQHCWFANVVESTCGDVKVDRWEIIKRIEQTGPTSFTFHSDWCTLDPEAAPRKFTVTLE